MDDEENIGGNASTDHDEAVLYEGGLQAKGIDKLKRLNLINKSFQSLEEQTHG